WLMSRACRPTCASPISPSISSRGTRAATESMTTMSTAPERTSVSAISSACCPLSGCEIRRSSVLTPHVRAHPASRACSASMNAAVREATHAKRQIDGQRARRDRIDLLPGARAELHDRALPELLLDLLDRLL